MTKLESEILSKICKVIDGVMTHEQFMEWFIPIVWDIPKEDKGATKLSYAIKIRFAEYAKGRWSKAELRERLIDLIV